ncbi:MAG: sensor histidine kinase [Candidatus Melainabacteria bacterium]|nr:sensor histidine kinase [Candidatus Melainabacteria bacterium]
MLKQEMSMDKLIESLDYNLQFVSELLQASIRLFVKRDEQIHIHNYFHPNQDSLYLGPKNSDSSRQQERFLAHKDISVDKAFKLGRPVIGQYGLVINNRRIQEFAYPISLGGNNEVATSLRAPRDDSEVVAVIAVERDIYLTRNILGQHWDVIADNLIKALKAKIMDGTRFPHVAFGEGAVILQKPDRILFANPLAFNLLAELAEHGSHLVGQTLDDLFASFPRKYKGKDEQLSIEAIEEISLRQRTIAARYVNLGAEMSVVLLKDNSEIKVKETLLKEIHHRVKNNLQTIASLLRMQKRRNPDLAEAFNEAINRTNSIALVHEHLSHSHDIETIDFGFLVQKILKGLISSFGAETVRVNYDCPEKVFVPSEDATNLALVLNEILSNTLEHTLDKLSQIDIELMVGDESLTMIVKDDGGGFPEGFDYKQSTGLGWEIVRTITEESLGGRLRVENYQDGERQGVRVELQIPL